MKPEKIPTSLRNFVQAEISRLREEFEERLRTAEAKLTATPAPVATPAPKASIAPVEAKPVAKPEPAPAPAPAKKEELAPEILALLSAAVAQYLGVNVKIKAARQIQPPLLGVSPWATQGRVFVQASHNLQLAQRAH